MAKAGRPSKAEVKLVDDITARLQRKIQLLDEEDKITNSIKQTNGSILLMSEELLTKSGKKLKVDKDIAKSALNALDAQDQITDALAEQFSGVIGIYKQFQNVGAILKTGMLNPMGAFLTLLGGALLLGIKFQKAIADTKKDLGVSTSEAAKLNMSFKGLEFAGKAFGLEAEDFKTSFQAARDNLGASTKEALGLSFNLAKISMESGATAEQLTSVLSVMESVSSASRDALLSQIEINRQMIEQAGLAPADIFRDIAENAEFFAEFAKDGSQNLVQAGIAAKKLGLNMSSVAAITNSLLDFESSIEKQLEASMLLGRQINLDRARQLALTGDQEGLMQEILKQVGGEAEFNRMNVIQRRALAESVGVNVEQLSRLVRNNTAGGAAGAVGAAVAGGSKDAYPIWERMGNDIHTMKNEMGK